MLIALSASSFWLLVASTWRFPWGWKLGFCALATVKLSPMVSLGSVPWSFGPRVADYLVTLALVPVLEP